MPAASASVKPVTASSSTPKAKAKTPVAAAATPKAVRAPPKAKAAKKGDDDDTATVATGGGDTTATDNSDASTSSSGKKKTVIAADPDFDRLVKEVLSGFDDLIARSREGKQNLTDLRKAYNAQIKDINKRRKIKRAGGAAGNCEFKTKSLVRGTKLHDFMKVPHGERLARHDVTQAIHRYAVENGLQRTGNHKFIELDSVLEELIGTPAERLAVLEERKQTKPKTEVTEDVSYLNLQTFIKKWFYTKAEEAKLVSNVASESASASASS